MQHHLFFAGNNLWQQLYRSTRLAILLILFAASVMGLLTVMRIAAFELSRGIMHADVTIYLIVGRGILNGLMPYRDLFEMKPPGIFYMSALSLWVSGTQLFALILYWILHGGIVAACGLNVWRSIKTRQYRYELTLLSICLCLLIILFIDHRSGPLQTESFGALFAILYVIVISFVRNRLYGPLLAGLAVLCAVSFKETLLPVCLASGILLSQHWKEWPGKLLYPLLLAGIVGFGLLWLTRLYTAFTSIYLPFIFTSRLHATTPLLLRGWPPWPALDNLTREPIPTLLYICTLLIVGIIGMRIKDTTSREKLPSIFFFALLLYPLTTGAVLAWVHGIRDSLYLNLIPLLLLGLVAATIGWSLNLWRTKNIDRQRVFFFVRLAVAFYLICLAIGVGNEYRMQYFTLIAPLLFAVVMFFLTETNKHEIPFALLGLLSLTVSAALLQYNIADHFARMNVLPETFDQNKSERFDAMIDACDFHGVFTVDGGIGLLVFSHHSPLGPLFTRLEFVPDTHALMKQSLANGTASADIVVQQTTPTGYPQLISDMSHSDFHRETPPCARPFLPFSGYQFLFRKQPADHDDNL